MPKEVDHDQRRHELADAVLRVVARGGLGSVTLREVATEAGWSTGVLNHYFDGKQDLLVGALRRAMQLIAAQIREASRIPDPREALEKMLLQVLPFDDTRVAFSRVWLSFCGEAVAGDDIRSYLAGADRAWRQELTRAIQRGIEEGQFRQDLDAEWIADCLGALTDGLSTRTTIQGRRLTRRETRATVVGWVDTLVPREPGLAHDKPNGRGVGGERDGRASARPKPAPARVRS
jgi:AcrR family transcriptional regulator